ncbi:MAG: hypothetical protein WC553_03105 [Patescibacteria group bacterium]|jgi:hypothetical protein
MAIKFTESNSADDKAIGTIIVDNGDLMALKSVLEEYGFVNVEALFRYALVALLNSSDNKLYIKRGDGNILAMRIADELIRKNEANPPTPTEPEAGE